MIPPVPLRIVKSHNLSIAIVFTGGIIKRPEKHVKDVIDFAFLNAPKSKNFIFGSFSVFKLFTCFFLISRINTGLSLNNQCQMVDFYPNETESSLINVFLILPKFLPRSGPESD